MDDKLQVDRQLMDHLFDLLSSVHVANGRQLLGASTALFTIGLSVERVGEDIDEFESTLIDDILCVERL